MEVDTKNNSNFYLIAIKDVRKHTKSKIVDEIDVEDIKSIRFEIGIDCGIKNEPLTIDYVSLNFKDLTTSNQTINDITAFTKLLNQKTKFYIKPVSVFVNKGFKELHEGQTAVSININTID